MNCTTDCPTYKAAHGNDDEAKEQIAKKWTERFGRHYRAADVCCDGCKAEGCHGPWCVEVCESRPCAAKNKVETCAHCEEHPCDKFQGGYAWAEERLDAIHMKAT